MGEVYRAHDSRLGRDLAIKILSRKLSANEQDLARFEREACSASALNHPNIITIFELGEAQDFMYFVMQLVEGISLSQWLKQTKKHPLPRKRLPSLEDIIRLADQVLEVLAFAHQEGVVHRDIKPENLLWIEKSRKVMVADFGLAAVYHTVYDEEKAFILGSPLYVSPEQARGESVDGRADLFSFGCVLLELTLGFLPVKVERPERIFQTRAKENPDMFTGMAFDHSPAVPRIWSDFIARALLPKREDRFADATAMLDHLRVIAPGLRGLEARTAADASTAAVMGNGAAAAGGSIAGKGAMAGGAATGAIPAQPGPPQAVRPKRPSGSPGPEDTAPAAPTGPG